MTRIPIVSFQGEHGAFSERAAAGYFHRSLHTAPVKSFDDVFETVRRRKVDYGIIPIENSLFGSIHHNYDLLKNYNLSIIGEVKLRIVHALLVNRGVSLRNVRSVYSHPQALGQCEDYLKTLRNVEIVAVYDTAGAAKMIREEKRSDAGAIASVEAARMYGLKIVNVGIESDHQNFTRFLVLGRKKVLAASRAKTSIIFAMKNKAGALFHALSAFALRGIDLNKIESRPMIGKPWEYLFYLDFEGSIEEEACHHALDHLRKVTTYLKILGSYRKGRTIGGRRR